MNKLQYVSKRDHPKKPNSGDPDTHTNSADSKKGATKDSERFVKNRAIGKKVLENRRTHHNPTTANSLQQQKRQRHKWLRQLVSFFKESKTREKPKTRHAHTRARGGGEEEEEEEGGKHVSTTSVFEERIVRSGATAEDEEEDQVSVAGGRSCTCCTAAAALAPVETDVSNSLLRGRINWPSNLCARDLSLSLSFFCTYHLPLNIPTAPI